MNTNYAGFWLRFVAWVIDAIVISIITWIILAVLIAVGVVAAVSMADLQTGENAGPVLLLIFSLFAAFFFVIYAILILYHTLLESSKAQGSLGKMALGLAVTDTEGNPLGFGKAFARNLCKVISDFTFYIGYILAGFTTKKQALHDVIVGTLVVQKQKSVS